MKRYDTTALQGSGLTRSPPRRHARLKPSEIWRGFHRIRRGSRVEVEPGRSACWVRTSKPPRRRTVSPTARTAGLLDIANGMAVRVDPRDAAFPIWT